MRIPDSTSATLKSVDDCTCVVRHIYLCVESDWYDETMVRTASALCTYSRYFATKILCTQINDWQHGLCICFCMMQSVLSASKLMKVDWSYTHVYTNCHRFSCFKCKSIHYFNPKTKAMKKVEVLQKFSSKFVSVSWPLKKLINIEWNSVA